ncbi:MAG: oligosaccharide flippase family protein [Candidatus Omnitrophota bacterium]
MNIIKKNIAANFVGNIWSVCMSLVFIPLYIYFMGIEAYGLIGIFVIIQTVSSFLDMGIGTTLNREMAWHSAYKDKISKTRDLLRTLEYIYWILAFLIAVIVFLAAPYISHKWIHGKQISPALIKQVILIMGITVALQGVSSFYSGGLIGLQRQVLLNGINIIVTTLRGAGAVIVLWLISSTIQAFFIWQLVISLLQVCVLAYFLWHSIPKNNLKAVFKPQLIKEIWHFAVGISGITIISVILTQVDKIVLSRLLPLDMFGYYILANTVSMGLYRIVGPISSAIYPRLTQLVALNDQKKLISLYHLSSQLISVLILSCAVMVAFFPREILFLWKQNSITIEHTYKLLSILILGTAINSLMNIPYGLQLAFGWTKLAFYLNLIAMLILIPLIFYFVSFYGAIGAASVWVILNSFYLLVGIHIMHRRLLKNEEWHWWIDDIGKPLISVILIALIGKLFVNINLPYSKIFIYLVLLFLSSVFISTISCSQLRNKILNKLRFVHLNTLFLKYENNYDG